MHLRYQYRVYPTSSQRNALAQGFGCARVVFNDALRARQQAYERGVKLSDAQVQRQVVTEAKRMPERAWLADVASVVLVQACQDARRAYRNWYDSMSGRSRGRKVGMPRFRSRKDHQQTIRFTRNGFRSRRPTTHCRRSTEVGIDLGLSTFAVMSNGKTIAAPKFLRRAEHKLRKAHRSLSRKQRGSNNRVKARIRVAKAYAAVADTRKDWAHKHSTAIIRENQTVFVEDLCVRGLARTRLAKSIHDAGWAMFTRMLEEKAARYGRHFAKVDRFYPSSQYCSGCGALDGPKHLSVREWQCKACGTVHDRDLNAAINIHAAGRAEWLNACGGAVSLSA